MKMIEESDDQPSSKRYINEDISDESTPRVTWSSTLEFVVSLIGYATGMSDFWRFPYLVWRNGGGAFLIAYTITMITCGVPLYFLEIFLGQYSGKGVFEIWAFFPLFKGIGISIALLNLCYVSYVSTMRYWLLEYLRQSFTTELPWTSCGNTWNTNSCVVSHTLLSSSTNGSQWNSTGSATIYQDYTTKVTAEEEFWQHNILSLSGGIDEVGSLRWTLVLWTILLKVIVIIGLLKSVKTIGKLMLVTTFFPPLIGLAMLIQALSQNGAKDGLLYLITPDFTKLATSKVWIESTFMAFYSLGPGWGGVMVMGSHMKFHKNCLRNVLLGIFGDLFIALFSSVVLFSVIGVMANEMVVPVEEIVKSGMSIGLVGYSRALAYLPFPYVWAVVFFLAVTIVGLDAQVVCTETVVSFLEGFGNRLGRHRRVLLVVLINAVMLVLNLPFCTQAGPYMFQLVDWYLPTWSVVVIALLEVIAIMWFYGGDRVDCGLQEMIGRKLPHVFRLAAAYISPVMFLLLLLISFVKYRPPKYGSYEYPEYTRVIGWVISCSVVIPIPLYIVWKFNKLNGTLKQKWTNLTQPSCDWGPSESAKRREYLDCSQTERTWTDIAYYNLTGQRRYPTKKRCEAVPLY
ncbi:sodium- and chloride-dependent glycine transporter 2-like [Pecten maximus]|uniref:sodium- and chloride-dependent glycine transporter 2-like n=1 Tax=Pecten maximus TaxID=6579 RepID=UPI0014584648|nr:sodium- and chloride-dependent glycine transporter 2-like [Pecten maximus]